MTEEEIEPNKTVFMLAIKEGADIDEAERIARAVAVAKTKTLTGRLKTGVKKWLLEGGLKAFLKWVGSLAALFGGALYAYLERTL